MVGLLGGYDPLAGLLGPAVNTNPLAMQVGLDPAKVRLGAAGQFLGGISDALLYRGPRRNSGGLAGAIGQIGQGVRAGGAAANKYGQEALVTKVQEKQALDKFNDDEYARQRAKEEDQAITTWVAGLPPDVRKWVSDNPELGKEAYKQAMEKVFDTSSTGANAANTRLSTTPQRQFNTKTQKWEDFQLGADGQVHKVEYPAEVEVQPPGAATIEGKKFANFDEMQNSAYTAITNSEQAAPLIESLRNDPNLETWGTGYAATALDGLPETVARGVKNRTAQLKSLAFFSKLPELKGMGALSNVEGDTATKAINRMDTATSYEEYIAALDDFESALAQMHGRNQRILNSNGWDEMDKVRRENAGGSKFKRSRVPPFPNDGNVTEDDWGAFSAQQKRDYYDAQKLVY